MLDFIFAALPILVLVVVMTMPKPLPSTISFLIGALIAFGIGFFYFGQSISLLSAAVLTGMLDALTPISIVFGAILFFVAMEKSGQMQTIRVWLRSISANPVAQIMIVGWSFIILIEGACGFGTPAALAAPILVALGFKAFPVAIFCLVANAIPTTFGAVGTPLWFGFGRLGLEDPELIQIGFNTVILQGSAALVVPVLAMRFLISWREMKENIIFIYASILASIIPMGFMALINFEFPAVIGGTIGVGLTIFLAKLGFGLKSSGSALETAPKDKQKVSTRQLALALCPLAVTIFILLLTRIPALGLRQLLTSTESSWFISLGNLGEFGISQSLVLQASNILNQGLDWSHALAYVPSIIPFVITALLALFLAKSTSGLYVPSLTETLNRIKHPVLALLGALAFVKLLMIGDESAPTMILGRGLADLAGETWIYFAPFLGALGSFFSGSTTVSNLTFGAIQASIAEQSDLSTTLLLSLQASGGSMGNMVCIHNIVAVCAVLGLRNIEGKILRKVFPILCLHGVILALAVFLLGHLMQ